MSDAAAAVYQPSPNPWLPPPPGPPPGPPLGPPLPPRPAHAPNHHAPNHHPPNHLVPPPPGPVTYPPATHGPVVHGPVSYGPATYGPVQGAPHLPPPMESEPVAFAPGLGGRPVRVQVQPVRSPLWVLGAHGGAGEDTVASLVPHSRAAGHAWPLYAPDPGQPRLTERPCVVLVARTSLAGLQAAQRAAGEWGLGHAPPVELLGLVLSADAPGRLPRPLRELVDVVAGGVARVWQLPWIESWRLGEQPSSTPKPLQRLVTDLLTSIATPISRQGASR